MTQVPSEQLPPYPEHLVDPRPQERRRGSFGRKAGGAGALALLATAAIALQNIAPYADDLRTMNDQGSMIEDVEGCPDIPTFSTMHAGMSRPGAAAFTPAEIEAAEKVELDYADKRSKVEEFEPKKFDPLAAALEWKNVLSHEITSFTSSISGVKFHIYSDREDPFKLLDLPTLDELFHAVFSDKASFEHVGVQALVDCMRHRFIDADGPRELEGREVNIFIPSETGICWSNGLIQHKPKTAPYKSFCDSNGATYMDLRLSLGTLHYSEGWSAFMTTSTDPEEYPERLSELAIHELNGHLWEQAAGLPFKLDPNEQLAQYIESQVIADVYNGHPPVAIVFS